MNTLPLDPLRRTLRRELRARRAAQPPAARRAAERLICARLARAPWFRAGLDVALYLSRDAEVDTAPLLALARRRGCRVFLPRITDYAAHRMLMVPAAGAQRLLGRYRIAEPRGGARRPAAAFAIVLMPLVGFDGAGNRLGNGAGYYDRFLANRRGRHGKPLLIGIAYECQRLEALAPGVHDVPLDAVITERGLHCFQRRP
ncbi:MAG TPA: 5-formyltetrahydrofolate cyclo-ligase [Steroidobacteraceae bacterium]|nr:5-formyltetrahydrofolate cyclo-ligase [Steroidobacteraceae bacterium]